LTWKPNSTLNIRLTTLRPKYWKLRGCNWSVDIEQVPPIYSAIRVDGERLYKKARRGEEVEIKKRNVTVALFEIDATHFPSIDFRIICSKGTYIRSMVRDFGLFAGSGAHMSALCRTRIGAFELKNAWDLTDFIHQKRVELKLEVDE
jgi:tRNA pseudouridine55 synthase